LYFQLHAVRTVTRLRFDSDSLAHELIAWYCRLHESYGTPHYLCKSQCSVKSIN